MGIGIYSTRSGLKMPAGRPIGGEGGGDFLYWSTLVYLLCLFWHYWPIVTHCQKMNFQKILMNCVLALVDLFDRSFLQ